jgi:CrcB protein
MSCTGGAYHADAANSPEGGYARRMTGMRLFWVVLGGGIGSGARFALGTFLLERLGTGFPWGTLAVNLIGSALLAALVHVSVATELVSADLRTGLAAGVLGGFTTYSAFSQETFAYLQDGAWGMVAVYVGVTVVGCLAACLFGYGVARWLVGS